MRVVILSFQLPPPSLGVGGSEWAVFQYAKTLAQRGHEVHVITQLDERSLPSFEVVEEFCIHRINRWHVRIVGTLLYFLSVYRKIRKLKPDVIHEQAIQGLGFFIKRFSSIPYIVFPRGTDLYLASSFFQKLVVKLALKSADALLGQTQDMAREMKKICPQKGVVVIPNGIDLERFRGLSVEDARQKLRINVGEEIILCVAHLRTEKGHEYLIEAMEKVIAISLQSRLFIVGRDFQRGKIQKLALGKKIDQKVVFTGFIPPDEIPEYMVAADVFVLPSLSEGFPNVLLEAMAAGLPIVATNVGGIPEIVTDGENGFLVESRNSQQLAEKILLLLKNENIRKRFSGNNIEKAKSYGWSNVIASLEEVYLRVKNR